MSYSMYNDYTTQYNTDVYSVYYLWYTIYNESVYYVYRIWYIIIYKKSGISPLFYKKDVYYYNYT